MLHGFPEFSYGWKKQIPYLASAGYRVWAPDQRGYNLSAKPDGIAAYSLDKLAADVIGLLDASGQKRVYLVGHDWGGVVAWYLASHYPDRLRKLVVINAPHTAVMQQHLRRSFSQLKKSWYMFFFQLPWLPETLSRYQNWKLVTQALLRGSRRGTFTQSDIDTYRRSWARPKAFGSMINWYRANVQSPPVLPDPPRITVPTLLIWGAQDQALEREMAQLSIDLCDNGELVVVEEATHWVHHEEASLVNELIDTFLRSERQGSVFL